MDFNGIDKIKINHAVIVFLMVICCFLFPLSLYIIINQSLFFSKDIMKLLLAIFALGCCEFGLVYMCFAISYAFKEKKEDWDDDSINHILRTPPISSVLSLIAVY